MEVVMDRTTYRASSSLYIVIAVSAMILSQCSHGECLRKEPDCAKVQRIDRPYCVPHCVQWECDKGYEQVEYENGETKCAKKRPQ